MKLKEFLKGTQPGLWAGQPAMIALSDDVLYSGTVTGYALNMDDENDSYVYLRLAHDETYTVAVADIYTMLYLTLNGTKILFPEDEELDQEGSHEDSVGPNSEGGPE